MSQAHAISWRATRRIPGSTLRLFVAVLFGATVLLPVGLIVLFPYVPPPVTPLMMRSKGRVTQNWVPLEAISRNLVRAVIAAEDDNFCFHDGFDWKAIDKAMQSNAAGKRLRGASTISQQTAKNLFLLPDRTWT